LKSFKLLPNRKPEINLLSVRSKKDRLKASNRRNHLEGREGYRGSKFFWGPKRLVASHQLISHQNKDTFIKPTAYTLQKAEVLSLPKAFVLINAETGSEKDVVEKVKAMKNVEEAYFVFGVYDVIAIVEAPNIDELRNTIHTAMRQIKGIRSTCTMVVIK
jgi:DNA-binding Lrp family transcriptional regulator